ncbi:hypothetical protein [Roseococcus suduntuyensis]|uniref:Uncharacterized protein n=2 Tax=Roseococcus suduntuyensis TaxID=455361 RepID=A0A840ADG7_9PROT|nr:hypothetical protein [Roseococcus suduntuyensis]MBB3899181.1 hypothetical protein [Roseococcus suduntuyensis]
MERIFGFAREKPTDGTTKTGLFTRQSKKMVFIPKTGVFEVAASGNWPEEIWYYTRDGVEHPTPNSPIPGEISLGTGEPLWVIMNATFALYVERCNDWLRKKNTNYQNWPPVSNFCRVIRNAIVHGGKINIENPNAPKVSWLGLSYDYTNLGRNIFDDLADGDFIILAKALDDEMTALGAPDQLP